MIESFITIEKLLISTAKRLGLFYYPIYSDVAEFEELVQGVPNEKKYIIFFEFPIYKNIKLGKVDSRQTTEEYNVTIRFLTFHKYHGEYVMDLYPELAVLRAVRTIFIQALKERQELRLFSPSGVENLNSIQEKELIHYTTSQLFGVETTFKISLNIPYDICLAFAPCTSNEIEC